MSTEILGLGEILGYDEGDDDTDVVGKARKIVRAARQQVQGVNVSNKEPTRGRELVLGFDSVANVAALATAGVSSNPQQMFRPERVTIPATIAPNFLLNSLTIGTAIQFLNATGVHAEVFGTTSSDVRLRMDTAQINSVITISATNLSAVALRFFAALLGQAVM
jgi:hypothetical protein